MGFFDQFYVWVSVFWFLLMKFRVKIARYRPYCLIVCFYLFPSYVKTCYWIVTKPRKRTNEKKFPACFLAGTVFAIPVLTLIPTDYNPVFFGMRSAVPSPFAVCSMGKLKRFWTLWRVKSTKCPNYFVRDCSSSCLPPLQHSPVLCICSNVLLSVTLSWSLYPVPW